MTTQFTPTRAEALARLQAFVPSAGRAYAARRNFDLGPGNHIHVSTLSPYLRCRLLTEEEVLDAVLSQHSYPAAEKFVQEVFWRTYWKGWLEMRPGVWEGYQQELTRAWDDVQTQSGLRMKWEAACQGQTEIDCFNAWAHELVETGYLHNHARMWFASIWIFTLRLPWSLGADFFLRHLLDGDPASNTLGWRWVAGIQTQGKTYLARASNIAKFTEGRFQPKWQLASTAHPLAAAPAPAPRALPADPNLDLRKKTGLLFHEDDLSPEFVLGTVQPDACAVLEPQPDIGPLLMADRVLAFRRGAQQDALVRWQDRLPEPVKVHDAESIVQWARAHELQQIVTPYAPVGPVAKTLAQVRNEASVTTVQVMRNYDRRAWPHATKGFFPFKKRIPDLLNALDAQKAS